MSNFTMKCYKCENVFPENEIQYSHDIPKYMDGKDIDGRHALCDKCHNEYEWEVIKVGLMSWIKQLPLVDKLIFKDSAKLVKSYFFKKKENDNG